MPRILILDDSPTVLLSIGHLLAEDGHVVEDLQSPMDLPRYLQDWAPDAILLDLQMPTVHGVSWGHYIRDYPARPLAMIIHSSRPWAEMEAAARELGADGILPKGAPPEAVRHIIRSALRKAGRAA